MRVALINPPQVFSKTQVTAGVVPPLGLLYLSAYLKQNQIPVVVIDAVGDKHEQYTAVGTATLRGLTREEIIDRIPADVTIVGISVLYSSSYLSVRDLMAAIKAARPSAMIVLGGAHSSCLPEYSLRTSAADVVVIGEGERPLLNLCRHPDRLDQVKGIVYKQDGDVHVTEPEELIADLDSLPFPDWPAINLDQYFRAAEPHGCSYSRKWVPILAGRGCPYDCTFCTTPLIWRRRCRVRSVPNVLAEMEHLHRAYGVTDFHFEDENLGTSKEWLHRFCDAVIESALPVTWQPSNGMRAETLRDPGLVAKMKRSGCSLLVFTLESASDRVRNQIMRKHLDLASVETAVALASRERLKSTCYFMIGLPGETLQEARETIRYARLLARRGLDDCVISLFSLLPGSELFNGLHAAGRVKLDAQFFEDLLSIGDLAKFTSWTDHISGSDLKKLRFQGYLGFILTKTFYHPGKVMNSLWNLVRGRDKLKSERVVRIFLQRALAGFRKTGPAAGGPRTLER